MLRAAALLCLAVVTRVPAQSPLAQADSAMARGEAWRATQLLTPVLAAAASRTPEAELLAARAAANWGGWSTVRALLEGETWLDGRFDRLGRRLLAQAALGEQRNPQALAHAIASLADDGGREVAEQAKRLVLTARAYDRLDLLDSAAVYYQRAGALLPDVADWLALRAAGVTRDSAQRGMLLASISLSVAKPRIPWTDALARDRDDDFAGSAAAYERLGARVAAVRVRWRGAASDGDRAALAERLVEVARLGSTAELRDALDLIRRIDPPFTREQRLVIGRRAAAINRWQDAADAFAAAAKDGPLAASDRVNYGITLGRLNRWGDAAEQFVTIREPAFAGRAAYYRARALLRGGDESNAVAALRQVVIRFPNDTDAAATALYLLADLATDAAAADSARSGYRRLATQYPSSEYRVRSALLGALTAFDRGDAPTAARELEAFLDADSAGRGRLLNTVERDQFRYWLARAKIVAGDSVGARRLWRALIERGPESYYALRAAARLDTLPWPPLAGSPMPAPVDSLDAGFRRATQLEALGLDAEARFERDGIAAAATGAEALLRTAQAFSAAGFPSRAAQLAARAQAAGVPRDEQLWRLLYPLPYANALRERARREEIDPVLAASVIKEESGFDPSATSRTDARGLMQVQPVVGRELARALGIPAFDPALLYIPDINLTLGLRHFATSFRRYPEMERALAAYNAGATRVNRWSVAPLSGAARPADRARDPLEDVELFVERIPFPDTRDYVRSIVRDMAMYRMLYDLGSVPPR